MKAALEGLLFISGDNGLTLKQISEILKINIDESKSLLKELYKDFSSVERGIKLEFLGGHFKLTTKEEHREFYEKLVAEEQNTRLSQSALEVLSIIAYNQPISRIQIDKIRGVNSSYVIRKLVLKNLIDDCGRSQEAGRPLLYKVTDNFLNYFGLGSINDLPEIEPVETKDEEKSLFETRYNEEQS